MKENILIDKSIAFAARIVIIASINTAKENNK